MNTLDIYGNIQKFGAQESNAYASERFNFEKEDRRKILI